MQRTEDERQRRCDLADVATGVPPRLLPWEQNGKPCYLSTEGGANSVLSRLADDMEAVQLGIGADVLKGARGVLDNPVSPHAELRYVGLRLAECLADVLRVAESRGARVPVPDGDGPDEGPALPAEAFG